MNGNASKVVIDSSLWLSYFLTADNRTKEFIESEKILRLSSAISIHEVKKKLLEENKTSEKIFEALEFMKNNSNIIDISEEICEKSASDSLEKKLHTVDSIIYRTAIENNAAIVTLDKHFKKIKQALVL